MRQKRLFCFTFYISLNIKQIQNTMKYRNFHITKHQKNTFSDMPKHIKKLINHNKRKSWHDV